MGLESGSLHFKLLSQRWMPEARKQKSSIACEKKSGKQGTERGNSLHFVEFTNGYGKDKPRFTCEYRGYLISASERSITFSNGLALDVKSGDVVILLGKVISVENYNQHL